MAIEINTSLFPTPQTQYAEGFINEPHIALSILALNIHITNSTGNLLSREVKNGHYFFRDDSLPTPRPATIGAWSRICRLGTVDSPLFILPFLPSLREDDEIGQAIGERGSKIHSLSRRSQLHLRDSEGRIVWGSIYLGSTAPNRGQDSSPLVGTSDRSNCTESLIVSGRYQHPASAQDSIRGRMESLASHGILGIGQACAAMAIPHVRRVLFQFTNQYAANQWAEAYVSARRLVSSDPGSIESDWKQMLHELVEAKRTAIQKESDAKPAKVAKEKNIPKFGTFAGLGDIDFP